MMFEDISKNPLSALIHSDEYYASNSDLLEDERLRSTRMATTYKGFMRLIGKIIDITNSDRERKITFIPFGAYKKSQSIETPIIAHRVYRRIAQESKPRFREHASDVNNGDKIIEICGQRFLYTVEFITFDDTYEDAENTMEDFEDLLTTFTGLFKEHGVLDIRFLEQVPDDSLSLKEDMFTKGLRYNALLEKITLTSEAKIKNIISNISID